MKKQTLLLAGLTLLLGMAVTAADAQESSVKVRVPFNFAVEGKALPAGKYSISSIRDRVMLQNSEGRTVAIVLANAVSGHSSGGNGQVVFRCYANQCFLSQLWSPLEDAGHQVQISKQELLARKREPGQYFALLGLPKQR